MPDPPVVDGRDRDAIRSWVTKIAPDYVPEWMPAGSDAGGAVVEVFAAMTADVLDRLNDVPEKQQVAFFDAMGFARQPPQPARVPVQFLLAESVDQNVTVPSGTQVVAPRSDGDVTFEVATDSEFEAIPATINAVYSVDPKTDQVFAHDAVLDGLETALFEGENRQSHACYFGSESVLDLNPGARIEMRLETNVPEAVLRESLVWEYYGTEEDTSEGWHPLVDTGEPFSGGPTVSDLESMRTTLDGMDHVMGAFGYERTHAGAPPEGSLRRLAACVRAREFESDGEHPQIPPSLLADTPESEALVTFVTTELQLAAGRLESAADRLTADDTLEDVTLTFDLPGTTTPTTVNGHSSRWLRCRIPASELAPTLFEAVFGAVALAVGPDVDESSTGIRPDRLYAGGRDVSTADSVRPFGATPAPSSTFYLTSAEAFSKPGAAIDLWFEPDTDTDTDTDDESSTDGADVTAELAWEYYDGRGWTRLPVETELEALSAPGKVRFEVPADMATTSVLGTEGRWVRVRIVSGDYGQPKVVETDDGSYQRVTDHIRPPRFGGVAIRYGHVESPDRIVTENNLTADDVSVDETERLYPFEALADDSQALYLGFDAPLAGGPLQFFVPIRGTSYPDDFYPRIRWEYCVTPAGQEWTTLNAEDGTESLTERGILAATLRRETAECRQFGRWCHWVRARVTRDEFSGGETPLYTRDHPSLDERDEPFRAVETDRFVHDVGRTSPVLTGLYANTAWARNVQTVTAETLGSSNGTAGQSFTTSAAPVLDSSVSVWVDELGALSAADRRAMESGDMGVVVDPVRASTGDHRQFWVQWRAVDDLAGWGPSDRRYTIDHLDGRVTFGDGKHGAIPPRGSDNIRIDYQTGGGVAGNVDTGAVSALKTDVPFVSGVTNPEPADGGADTERVDAVLQRAPTELRDRGRAVTPADFERVALASSRELARVQCEPGIDGNGERASGWVTLLVVPHGRDPRPTPSAELRHLVHEAVSARAPATLLDPNRPQLVVRGPSYVAVDVDVQVGIQQGRSVSAVERSVDDALSAFFHPLTGGDDGDGWAFGRLPHRSDVYALVEGLDGIDQVAAFTMRFRAVGNEVTVTEGESNPEVAPDALVTNGRHVIEAFTKGGRRR